jgi:hypothetical protein
LLAAAVVLVEIPVRQVLTAVADQVAYQMAALALRTLAVVVAAVVTLTITGTQLVATADQVQSLLDI